jgi:predicted SnoaL-like aldol condensation-catalyzing enzyme
MKAFRFALVLPLLAVAPAFAQNAQLDANKALAHRFFEDNIFANPEKIDEVIHPDYIQHNPVFARYNEENNVKGRDGLKQYLASRRPPGGGQKKAAPATPPPPPTRIYMSEGDLVTVIQARNAVDKDGKPYTSWWFDTWRVKDGKLYEHWDGATLPTQ